MRASQIGDAPTEEVRKRWRERAVEVAAAERTTLATRLANLSSPAKKRLRHWAANEGLPIPKLEELIGPTTATKAARRLISILAHAKTQKRRLRPLLWVPNVGRGRPVQDAARELVIFLAIDYEMAKKRSPALTANPRAPGPFVRLVAEALRLAGTPHVDAVELVNWYGSVRRRGKHAPSDRQTHQE
jgi:hypothetical protein